jgi:hypothetical protein
VNPWDIIGWAIIAIVTVPLMALVVWRVGWWACCWIAHFRTRNTPLRVGQRWIQDFNPSNRLYVWERHKNGVWSIGSVPCEGRWRTTHSSFGETEEQWRERARNRRLICATPERGGDRE